LAAKPVNGSENGVRPGTHALLLLAAPLNVSILRSLDDGPKGQTDLRKAGGLPAQTTLRAHLKELAAAGTIVKHRENSFPGVLEFELTEAGRELLPAMHVLERWLERAPEGPLELGSEAAKTAIKALVEGWSTTMLRALATRPLSLTELDRVVAELNYPSLERRLAAMRLVGQIEAREGNGRGTPYVATAWARQGAGPLAAAIRWERRHLAQTTAPLTRLDAETALLMVVPMLRLPKVVSGSCRLAVDLRNGAKHQLAGVMVELQGGRVASCATRLQGYPDAWTSGAPAAWLDALLEADTGGLEVGGDSKLARAVLGGLHSALGEDAALSDAGRGRR
jgi:DNA-binding HxlR family transcriptional regulator